MLVIHLIGLVATAAAGRVSMRSGLVAAALAPAITACWALSRLVSTPEPRTYELVWVEALDLVFRFRSDSFAMLMTVIVSGIGALVFAYSVGYFGDSQDASVRFPTTLLAFSASMLGLVLADSIWTLFIFWEFTSVTSFLLVGHKHVDAAVQGAARRALMITGAGGLALLAGLLLLGEGAGTSLSSLQVVTGTKASIAAVLVLVGVATKSAQVPFHVWLPGAMAAPTPVSAYLHSATMVKAGIVLMAVTGSAFADVGAWKAVGFALGATTMWWGAIGALRQRDAKLIMAWGTVSQLGFIVTLLALGTGKAVFAATSVLVAHALFKAALFLVVGEIDIRTGTRDIDELGGLYRTMPIAFGAATLAGLSMAGVPPLLGFAAKEAGIEAALTLSGGERVIALVAIVGGSVATVAYTTRFLWTVFGPGPATQVAPKRMAMTVPAVILALAGLAGFVWLGWVNGVIVPAATELNAKSSVYELLRWPGLTTAFIVSMVIVVSGAIGGALAVKYVDGAAPQPLGADAADGLIDRTLVFAPRLIARVQHGSLPVYLATMAFVLVVAATPFLTDVSFDHVTGWDHALQLPLGITVAAAAVAGAFVDSRLGAALALGAVGIAVSGLFVIHGAPDLALTQLLVETIVVVGFVIGLGHLARRFPKVENTWKAVRITVAVAGGLVVPLALVAASASPTGAPPIAELVDQGVETGGGNNIVNVILTDIRALDTLGEVVVLATVAVGILALGTTRLTEDAS